MLAIVDVFSALTAIIFLSTASDATTILLLCVCRPVVLVVLRYSGISFDLPFLFNRSAHSAGLGHTR